MNEIELPTFRSMVATIRSQPVLSRHSDVELPAFHIPPILDSASSFNERYGLSNVISQPDLLSTDDGSTFASHTNVSDTRPP